MPKVLMAKKNLKVKQELILEAQEYTRAVVRKIAKHMTLHPDIMDEIEAAGNLGLVEAADKYDPSKGVDFKNFAYLRIRGAVIDAVRQVSSISRNSYHYQKALEAVQSLRECDLEINPYLGTESESAEQMLAKVFDIAADGALAFRLTFEDFETEVNNEANQDLSQEQIINRAQIKKKILDAIATLPEKQRLIVEGYYFHDKSFVDVADEEAGRSKSWVSRLHQQALNAIKEALGDMEFEDYFLK
jgi:RNA polymerase sigma factor for flagellar operon FliA